MLPFALLSDPDKKRFRKRLPKASIGKSCVRFKRLSDLDETTLRELIRETAAMGFGM